MSNLPRFVRPRQRPSAVPPPVPAALQPAAEPKPEILPFAPAPQTLQPSDPIPSVPAPPSPLKESPRRPPSPPRKATSPFASPKYGASVSRSPPVSPSSKYSERRNGETTPPQSPAKSGRKATPPLSPLALPRTQVASVKGTAAQPRIQPEVAQKSMVHNKTVDVEKPARTDRPAEYGSGKPHQKQLAPEVINLTGHNVGAVMEINQPSAGHGLGGETIKKNETEGGGVRQGHEKKKKGSKKKPPMTAFMNSNFQSVNNSVLYDSSCSHRDPGLHLAFPDAADGDRAIVDGHKNYKPQ